MFPNNFLLLIVPLIFSSIPIICQLDNVLPLYTNGGGEWRLLQRSIGVSAMHMQLLHNNKVIIFDRTDFGRSSLALPDNRCRYDPKDTALTTDCTAHSLLYDVESNTFRPLAVQTDTWCSSGGLLPNGTLVQTGGYNDGDHAMRMFTPCGDGSCDWVEYPNYLVDRRWYATNQMLPDGRVIIIGGRRQFNYEFYPRSSPTTTFSLPFLLETRDNVSENNLYPFLHLLPDGTLFIFANTRAISFNYNRNKVVKEFPPIPGSDPRNYPSTGSSIMLPIDDSQKTPEVEIMICGGSPRGSYEKATKTNFVLAVSTCGRIRVTDRNPNWVVEEMPMARVMGDMVLLPTGDVLIINGAEYGTAGWENARSPVTRPVLYKPSGPPEPSEPRFSVMSVGSRPRMYHSTAILLPNGRVLVGGSNPHQLYNFDGVDFPTDLSLEAFSPPYLSNENDAIRPKIISVKENLRYGEAFSVSFQVTRYTTANNVSVRIVPPSFNTHSISMNQRMVVLKMIEVMKMTSDSYSVTLRGPSTSNVAPPGYYMLFVVHGGVPSHGTWVNIQ